LEALPIFSTSIFDLTSNVSNSRPDDERDQKGVLTMKETRDFILKLGIGLFVLALAFGAGRAIAQTQDDPGNTDTGLFPANSPGSHTWEDEPDGGLQKQAEASSASASDENIPTYAPGLQYEGIAPDENVGTADVGSALLSSTFSYYMVPGSAFHGKSSTAAYAYVSAGCIYSTSAAEQFIAELHIPNGSEIKYLRIYYRDTNATELVTGYITSISPGVSSLDLVNVSSTGSSGFGTAISVEKTETVDTSLYAYTLIFWPTIADNTIQFCGMRVAYYAPIFSQMFIPLIEN
jgi:hypothetical protein